MAGGTSIEEAERWLKGALEEFRDKMQHAGVDASVSRLGLLPLADLQWEQRRLVALEASLREVEPSVSDPRVLPLSIGEYWHKLGLLESERANFSRARQHFETALWGLAQGRTSPGG